MPAYTFRNSARPAPQLPPFDESKFKRMPNPELKPNDEFWGEPDTLAQKRISLAA